RIGRRTLAERTDVVVAILELGNVAASSEQCLDIPPGARLRNGAVEPGAHAGEAGEVLLNERARVLLGDAQLAGERERSLPVDGAEVYRLGARAHLGCHLRLRHAEDDRRGLTVDVTALFERLDEGRVAREVSEQAQLDLGVVGREEERARGCDERTPDGLAARGAH